MIYKFARIENETIKKYEFDSYETARDWVDQEINQFKIKNKIVDENDCAFTAFKTQYENMLNKQKDSKRQVMDDYLKCKNCNESDHEGKFCRCEDRNIRIAKEMRSRDESPWNKSQIEINK